MDNFSSRRVFAQVIRRDPKTLKYHIVVPPLFITITMMVKEIEGVGFHARFTSIQPLGFVEFKRNDGITVRAMFSCQGGVYITGWHWFSDHNPFMRYPEIYVTDQITKNFIFCKA
ncbi:MAG: hypothetical protein K2H60_01500 [Muribaculaceae bacterium]|nr:hypothetical protein [Muribaculaceae bacterium]